MKSLIMAYYAKKLDDGNMNMFFVKDKVGEEAGLTELGKQVVNTEIALAKQKRNEDPIVTGSGRTYDTNEYVVSGGNYAKVINFSDAIAFNDVGLNARKYIAESKASFKYDTEHVVSPAEHKENLQFLNDRFKKDRRQFTLTAVDKKKYKLTDFNVIYYNKDKFYDVSQSGATVADEVVFLRKVSFVKTSFDDMFVKTNNTTDESEYMIWLRATKDGE